MPSVPADFPMVRPAPDGAGLTLSDGSDLPAGGDCFLVGRLSHETEFLYDYWFNGKRGIVTIARHCVVEARGCFWRRGVQYRRGPRKRGGPAAACDWNVEYPLYAFPTYRPARDWCDELTRRHLVRVAYATLT